MPKSQAKLPDTLKCPWRCRPKRSTDVVFTPTAPYILWGACWMMFDDPLFRQWPAYHIGQERMGVLDDTNTVGKTHR